MLLARPFDEDWAQRHNLFERISAPYVLCMEDKCDHIGIALRTGALDFYDHPTRSSLTSYSRLTKAFGSRNDSLTCCEIHAAIAIACPRRKDKADHSVHEGLLERIELLNPHLRHSRPGFRSQIPNSPPSRLGRALVPPGEVEAPLTLSLRSRS